MNIKLEIIELDRPNLQHKSPEYLAINPRGQVTALVDGDKTFADSAAILVYLAGSYPDPKTGKTPSSFWSSDVAEQAEIVDWLAIGAGWIGSGLNVTRRVVQVKDVTEANKSDLETATRVAHKSLEILETRLSGNECLALGMFTIADIAAFVYVSMASFGNISLEPYSSVQSWVSRIQGIPGYFPIGPIA